MYIRPKKGLPGLLSTHMDSRSSRVPTWAQAPTIHAMPLTEVQRPIPWPPHPDVRSPANHIPRARLYTTTGSPKFDPCPVAKGDGSRRVKVRPPLVETDT